MSILSYFFLHVYNHKYTKYTLFFTKRVTNDINNSATCFFHLITYHEPLSTENITGTSSFVFSSYKALVVGCIMYLSKTVLMSVAFKKPPTEGPFELRCGRGSVVEVG